MTCQFAHLDGAYVLGSLAPTERLDFEAHLPGCAECSRSVRELAGLPGLLAQVDPADLEARTPDAPLPSTLLPALVREVRGQQRRRSVLTALVAAAVAALFVGALAVGGVFDRSGNPSAASPAPSATRSAAPAQAMVPVGAVPVTAAVALTGVAWGTKLDLTCSYPPPEGDGDGDDDDYGPIPPAYALVVHTREGGTEQVATWKGLPGRTMRLTGATATGRTDITSVDVRSSDGRVLLTLPV
jgi:putative zinc finger protein